MGFALPQPAPVPATCFRVSAVDAGRRNVATVASLLVLAGGALLALAGCGGSGDRGRSTDAAPTPGAAERLREWRPLEAFLTEDCRRRLFDADGVWDYDDAHRRCLAGIPNWDLQVAGLEAVLSEPAARAASIDSPPIDCVSPADWQAVIDEVGTPDDLELGGVVRADDPTILLAPVTCLALDGVPRDPELPCLVSLRERCRAGSTEAAIGLATLAHEAQHVDGVQDEAVADCRALQRVDDVARALGVPADQAAQIGAFVSHLRITPDDYRSGECRPGGELDLEPETPAFP